MMRRVLSLAVAPSFSMVFRRALAVVRHHSSCKEIAMSRTAMKPFCFQGDVFTDGAMRGPAVPHLRRAGWSAVSVDNNGLITFGLYGACPDEFPSAFRAELLAVERALAYACPPLTIHVDNQEVINGIQRGEIWCCASARPAADIWRRVWWRLNDIDSVNVHFVKVKGHATEADSEAGRTTRKYMIGNSHADYFAGYGVTIAEECAPVWTARNACEYAKRWYKWLLTLASSWPDDMQRPTKSEASSETKQVVPKDTTGTAPACVHSQCNSVQKRGGKVEGNEHMLMVLNGLLLFCTKCATYSSAGSPWTKRQV